MLGDVIVSVKPENIDLTIQRDEFHYEYFSSEKAAERDTKIVLFSVIYYMIDGEKDR